MKKASKGELFVTIDIGSVSVKAVCLEIADKNKRLVAVAEEKYKNPIGGIDDDADKNAIIDALKNVVKSLNISKNANISACFFNREMQVKIIDLPNQIQQSQIEQTLNWEARKLLSPAFKDTPYTFAYKFIRKNSNSIALAVIPISVLEKYSDLFKSAGIKLSGIYPEVFSGMTLRPMADIAGLPAVSIVNVGYYGTHLQIFSAGELKFYRYIPSGVSELSDPPEAGDLEVFSQKIRFSFDYFRAVTKLNQIDLLCFMGGGSAVEGLLAYEQAYFAPTKIAPLDISSGIDVANAFATSQEVAEDKQKKLLSFIPAVGIALSASSSDATSTNFLAQILLKKRTARNNAILSVAPVVVSVAILITVFTLILPRYRDLKQQIRTADANINTLNKDIENLKQEIKDNSKFNMVELPAKYDKIIGESIRNLQKSFYNYPLSVIRYLANGKDSGIVLQEVLIKSHEEAKRINLKSIDNDIEEPNDDSSKELSTEQKEDKVQTAQKNPANTSLSNDMLDIGLDGLEESEEIQETNTDNEKLALNKELETDKKEIKTNAFKQIKESDKAATNIYLSSLAQDEYDEQTIKECFEGKMVIIKGIADKLESLGKYVDLLVSDGVKNKSQDRCIKRVTSVISRETKDGIEFLIKGDLP